MLVSFRIDFQPLPSFNDLQGVDAFRCLFDNNSKQSNLAESSVRVQQVQHRIQSCTCIHDPSVIKLTNESLLNALHRCNLIVNG
jgi:hypothetical protein